jgi:predicted helicase
MSIQTILLYQSKVERLIRYGGSRNEGTLEKEFIDLLQLYAGSRDLVLVPKIEYRTSSGRMVVPDGTLKDALRYDWGYWESKDEKDDLEAEIEAKFAKGYPSNNILFEDNKTAILYQNGIEVMRSDFDDVHSLDNILTQFASYESPEISEFHKAIDQFSEDVPRLAITLRSIINDQYEKNSNFKSAVDDILILCRKAINPKVDIEDVTEMLIQHILTEDIFMTVFDDPQFHRENIVAKKLAEMAEPLKSGMGWHNLHGRIAPYYETINARAAQIYDHHEKQKFLKALYENFYRAYNPKAADRLGVIYTPNEIVRFMIEGTDSLLFKNFGKTLGNKDVEILDPATGTGTFITEIIEYLPLSQLEYKYKNEIYCNEVSILPYYIANLNIEYTYKQKTGTYLGFNNICFVDTLDNMGFIRSGGQQQIDFLSLFDENTLRIMHQNQQKISIIIANPPYNAHQINANQNNPNRKYPAVDRRIKNTYVKYSKAQNLTKLYDMYTRFIRWASDRLDENGIIAFVSNNSFIDATIYDGFRKVVADEFNEIYIIDMKGFARTSGERRRREGGNVFSNQIKVGIAIYFLVRRAGSQGCKIYYNAVPDHARSEEKNRIYEIINL